MPSNHLSAYVDAWTVSTVMASRWLTRLYRALGDDRQATLAIQAGNLAAERMNRLGLQSRVAPLEEGFALAHPGETQAEEGAWIALIEAQTGLAALYAILDHTGAEPTPGLRGTRTATYAALRKAIRGFRAAFPDVIAEQGVATATHNAAATCVDAFMTSLDDPDVDRRDRVRAGLEECVLEALEKALAA